jgi:SAM-dependent methyltransferase
MELGTPLADDPLGLPYVKDFVAFIDGNTSSPARALEIGAGVGFTSKCLMDRGWQLDIVEPGRGYEAHWARYGLTVINDYFPTPLAKGPYDLIVSYAVLEHIAQPEKFLADVRAHLSPNGRFIMAVPDCEDEIASGDPAMLIHEHFNYFERTSLAYLLAQVGFKASIQKSSFGRALYAVAIPAPSTDDSALDAPQLALLESYTDRCSIMIARQQEFMERLASKGSLGIYCPTRALAVLPIGLNARFFDDSPTWQGRYVPPFKSPIESRQALLEKPTDYLLIMTRTFGDRLKAQLEPVLENTEVFTVEQMLNQPVPRTAGSLT